VRAIFKENKRLDSKVGMLLLQCICATIFRKISKAITSKHTLEKIYAIWKNKEGEIAIT